MEGLRRKTQRLVAGSVAEVSYFASFNKKSLQTQISLNFLSSQDDGKDNIPPAPWMNHL
jgi:hypothetical protein